MKSYNKDIGNYSEKIAERYLESKGYYILDKNFRNKFGEVDIICRKADLIIFVEIKSRYTNSYGSPLESVTCYKQNKILSTSKYYIYKYKLYNYYIRYDVIELLLNNNNNSFKINHYKDAFRSY